MLMSVPPRLSVAIQQLVRDMRSWRWWQDKIVWGAVVLIAERLTDFANQRVDKAWLLLPNVLSALAGLPWWGWLALAALLYVSFIVGHAYWEAGGEASRMAAHLAGSGHTVRVPLLGKLTDGPVQPVADANRPSLETDSDGTIHPAGFDPAAGWQEQPKETTDGAARVDLGWKAHLGVVGRGYLLPDGSVEVGLPSCPEDHVALRFHDPLVQRPAKPSDVVGLLAWLVCPVCRNAHKLSNGRDHVLTTESVEGWQADLRTLFENQLETKGQQ